MKKIMSPDDESVTLSVEDGIATVTLSRPAARNALSLSAMQGLYESWEYIDLDPSIRVAILTSADCGTFCAGMDLKETARVKQETGKDILSFMKDPFHFRMRRVKVPIVAAMTGHLMAGGMLLSLNCDLRVGLKNTKIGITESKIGRGSPWGMPLLWMLPQPIVMQMVLTAELCRLSAFWIWDSSISLKTTRTPFGLALWNWRVPFATMRLCRFKWASARCSRP